MPMKKKRKPPKRGLNSNGQNLVQRTAAIRDAIFDVGFNIGRQWILDLLAIAGRDSDALGRTISFQFYKKLTDCMMEKEKLYWDALTNTNESDYYQEKMDEILKSFIPADMFDDFETRYPDMKKQTYERRK